MKSRAKRTTRSSTAASTRSAAKPSVKAASRRAAPARGAVAAEAIGSRAGGTTAAAYSGVLDTGQEQLSRVSLALLQGYGDAAQAGRENVDVLMRASGAVARAAEDMGKAWADLAQLSLHNGATLARAVAEARSIQEVVDLQADLACQSVDRVLFEGKRLSELSETVANEAVLPVQARFAHVLGAAFGRPD